MGLATANDLEHHAAINRALWQGFADAPGTAAKLDLPTGVAVDGEGFVYVADKANHRIRTISPAGDVTTLAGSGVEGFVDGFGTAARFSSPVGIAVDASGSVYVADSRNMRIRKITATGQVSTLTDVPADPLRDPSGVAVDGSGTVYVADSSNQRIRKIAASGAITTLAGDGTEGFSDGTGVAARFGYPTGLAVGSDGKVYVADQTNQRVRQVTPSGQVTTIAGGGTCGTDPEEEDPGRFAGCRWSDGGGMDSRFAFPAGVAVGATGTVYVADRDNFKIRTITPAGQVTSLVAFLERPAGLAFDASGSLYVAEKHRIVVISPTGGSRVLAGGGAGEWGFVDGDAAKARFTSPQGIALDRHGIVYVADRSNNAIRKITPSGDVSTLAGDGSSGLADGLGPAARFRAPTGVALDAEGTLYVADDGNHCIRKITPAGQVTTLAGDGKPGFADGSGTAARFTYPRGLTVDADGTVYVADQLNHRIRAISPAGKVSIVAGGAPGFLDGILTAAAFYYPYAVAIGPDGALYVADHSNQAIRVIR